MILITGASGYLGSKLYGELKRQGLPVCSAGRSMADRHLDLASNEDYSPVMAGVDTVVHCAGIAHSRARAEDYDTINHHGSVRLALAAKAMGVSRFLFFSTLNVVPIDADDPNICASQWTAPDNLYAASKHAAEIELLRILTGSECQLLILRPALVYDTELTGNLKTLKQLGRWFPFALPDSGSRSMVSRPDLVAMVGRLLAGEGSGWGETQHIALTDGQRYAAQRIGEALMGPRAWSPPNWLWRALLLVCAGLPSARTQSIARSLSEDLWTGMSGEPEGCDVRWDLQSLLESPAASGGGR